MSRRVPFNNALQYKYIDMYAVDLFVSDSMHNTFLTAVVLFGIATIVSFFQAISANAVGPNVKVYYYINMLITMIPLIMNALRIFELKLTFAGNLITESFLGAFYVEWMITTPLMLILFALHLNLQVYQVAALIFMDILMLLSGYISYLSSVPAVSYSLYAIGVLNYITLCRTLNNMLSGLNVRTAFITNVILGLSGIYPILHILLKNAYISIAHVLVLIVILEVMIKGIVFNATVYTFRMQQRNRALFILPK